MDHQWVVRTAWLAYNEPQHSWARRPGSTRRSKMSDSKQEISGNVISVRGSSVRCDSECNLDSDSFGRQALTCCVTVDTRHQQNLRQKSQLKQEASFT